MSYTYSFDGLIPTCANIPSITKKFTIANSLMQKKAKYVKFCTCGIFELIELDEKYIKDDIENIK